jgi:hypothetical protein
MRRCRENTINQQPVRFTVLARWPRRVAPVRFHPYQSVPPICLKKISTMAFNLFEAAFDQLTEASTHHS